MNGLNPLYKDLAPSVRAIVRVQSIKPLYWPVLSSCKRVCGGGGARARDKEVVEEEELLATSAVPELWLRSRLSAQRTFATSRGCKAQASATPPRTPAPTVNGR